MYFGSKIHQRAAFSLLDQYQAAGGNFIDTANNYAFWMKGATGGESEDMIGSWIRSRRNRDMVIVATKVGARPVHQGADMDKLEGLSYHTIVEAAESSLKRLKTDYIDLYYAHVDWYDFPLEERLRAFDKLKQDGKVREIGASNIYPWRYERSQKLSKANTWPMYCCAQLRYSYLRPKYDADFWAQRVIWKEWLDYVKHNDTCLVAYSPLLSGVHTQHQIPEEYDTSDSRKRMTVITEMSEDLKVSVNQLVISWMIHEAPSIIPLIAASKPEQLKENLEAAQVMLTAEQVKTLNNAGD